MKYISVDEAGKKFNLSARSIRNYCAQGRIPGAVLKGKTWLIPEDAGKPNRINNKENEESFESIKAASDMLSFINESPVAYVVIDNIKKILINNGYKEVEESKRYNFKVGDKVFFTRNNSSLVAFNIGKNINEDNINFHVVASHADSPAFKIKPLCEDDTCGYKKLNVAPYGGLIASTWFDRPLSVAGRVMVDTGDKIETKIVNLTDFTLFIPNLCIHFNREINSGYTYDYAVDTQPFYSLDQDQKDLKTRLAKKLKVNVDNISNYDLFVYNKQSGVLWGDRNEFISCPRLDDLECVYTSLTAFRQVDNDNSINVLYIADNEEVGSSSRQGANGDFLPSLLKRICSSLSCNYEQAVANSFLISADNGHAVHPNKPHITDVDNKAFLNKGVVIKFNASNSYTSDSLSSSIFQKICDNAHVPYQYFTNKSGVRGGSTLGNLLLSQVSFISIDIGLAQLAMHSSYETAGSYDVKYLIDAFKEFYQSNIEMNNDSYRITK